MSHHIQFDHVDPFKSAAHQNNHNNAKSTTTFNRGGGGGGGGAKFGNGGGGKGNFVNGRGGREYGPMSLSIQYEEDAGTPFRRDEVRPDDMGWDRNDVPIPRAKRDTYGGGPRKPTRPKSTRVESVFDCYVDMYANDHDDDGSNDVEEQGDDRAMPYHSSSTRQENLVPYESHVQSSQPWDERGKNGLYGGGGRGADDRETGWVRDYAFGAAPPPVGFEEDLRFDQGEDEDPHDYVEDEEDRPRSSSDTAQSGSYPVTPTSSHFPMTPTKSNGSLPTTASPPRSATTSSHSKTPSASYVAPFRTPERPARTASPVRDVPISTKDSAILRKKAPQAPAFSTPSSPQLVAANAPQAEHTSPAQDSPRPPALKRNNSLFKWHGRSKRPPPISNPILPDGFVESLGMKTFTLTPGCKAPTPGSQRAASPAPPMPTTPDRPAPPRNYGPHEGAPSPPRPSPPRSASSSRHQSPRNGSSSTSSPSVSLPARGFRGSADRQSDFYPQEAMTRLSMSSGTSTRSDPTGPHSTKNPNHRQFFDQLRNERSRPEEVHANRGVVVTNSAPIQSIPLRQLREPYGGDFASRPTASTAKQAEVGYGQNWGSAVAVSGEDQRGTTIHTATRPEPVVDELDDETNSEYSDADAIAGSRRPSMMNPGHDLSYYQQTEQYAYRPQDEGGYNRSSQLETLEHDDDNEERDSFSHVGVPIKPLTVRRTPPSASSPFGKFPPHPPPTSSVSSGGSTPRTLAQFNRGPPPLSNRASSIDPFSSPARGSNQNQRPEGPAIRGTGFRNPFG